MDYKISQIMASSSAGKKMYETEEDDKLFQTQLETQVTMNIAIKQFPNDRSKDIMKPVKFSMGKDKFLQFSKDMKDAFTIMSN